MKFNRKHLEELTLQKIKEVNDEAGYRSYLEVPEMVNIIASIMEEKFNVLFDSQKDQIRSLRAYNDILEKENDSMTDTETKTLKQYEEDWKRIFKTKDQQIENFKKIIHDTLRALPVGNINTHTPDTIPERVQDWVKEAVEECSLREKWEELADNLIPYAEDFARYLEEGIYKNNPFSNHRNYQAVSKVIEQYEKLKK